MRYGAQLQRTLSGLDGRGYASYRQIRGQYRLGVMTLHVDHVQTDPFAPPSLMRISVPRAEAGLPPELTDDHLGRVATADFLTRRFAEQAAALTPSSSGTGNSGSVSIGRPGQQVLERTTVLISQDRVEARIVVGLPASGRKARGKQAAALLTDVLPQVAEKSLFHRHLDASALEEHVTLYRDQEHLRGQLAEAGLVAFVGDGAILPRRSGDSDLPMSAGAGGDEPVPFTSPESLRVSFTLPSGGTVTGMGVPEGITVIVGGGYHGKSTLLRGIERGVYAHVAGDGREWVITRADAVSVRAEDARAVTGVDISAFISGLPSGADTRRFSTTNASGSTSQAANLVEALDAGASALLIDEDTSATNFMIRDERMRQLIPADREPITPFVDRVRPLYSERGVSTVLVAGGSGAFFDVADTVLALDAYTALDVTQKARELAGGGPDAPQSAVFSATTPRVLQPDSLNPAGKTKPAKARGRTTIHYGRQTIDLAAVAQLVDPDQTQAIARALDRLAERVEGRVSIAEAVAELIARIDAEGLDVLSGHRGHPGHLTRPRPHELHAAVNRYRGLKLED
ncbi:ABC-ATPase domain-containing protein [Nesterenkonia alba]|uniref:ABC-ATPase domain-containing protein n=1 Tax=Nesterenkonia alba TaxID=515814 RepID=UPI00041B591A|nr:ABC-ATPase domain-containing protein [Nesterenkonia alba]